ncbi:MAG: UDP-4-amino-4,6-dideoxy-N-acetyl-beta-L-altrosamine transaminase [Methanomicrobiaceae archaeon]|nr:UDP-4-amino-4,6-dideoxy-N-acetyl-beta-L-altrosamine transaminase [Methanomicrobiaceae archaeon]
MTKRIPYGRQSIDQSDIDSVINVLKSDWLTTGPMVDRFESSIKNYIGCREAVSVNSGTSALDIAIKSLGIKEGNQIITTPFTFVASSNAILYNNLTPVFSDIEKETRNLDPLKIEEKITDKTKAILYVDYAGHPCNIKEIKEIADQYGLYLIEDACHALGAEYQNKKVGNFADVTIFSFHPVKPITTGEGGAVATNNDEIAGKLRILRDHGIDRDSYRNKNKTSWGYDLIELGRNYRITDLQAALGVSQFKKLDEFISRRNEIAAIYNDELGDVDQLEIPHVKKDCKSGWHIYTILINGKNRNKFYSMMEEQGVGVNIHYIPVYHHTYYKSRFNISTKDFPVTEDVFNRIVTLPLFYNMSDEQIDTVINTTKKSLKMLN